MVSLAEEDGMAIVSVKDSGCGIDDENQKKLLHTDTHFSTFGTNNEEGSGLGLLLCQDFVVKNGGKLWFTSKKGDGSTFSFSIPLLFSVYRLQIALKSQYEHFLVSSVCVKGSSSLNISSNNVCRRSRNSSSKKAKLFTGIFGLRGSPISITGE